MKALEIVRLRSQKLMILNPLSQDQACHAPTIASDESSGDWSRSSAAGNLSVFFSHAVTDAFRTTLVSKQPVPSPLLPPPSLPPSLSTSPSLPLHLSVLVTGTNDALDEYLL